MSMKFLKTVAGAAVSSLWEKVSGNVVVKDTSANVGIGTTDPESLLNLYSGSAGTVSPASAALLTLENDDHVGINLLAPDGDDAFIAFGEGTDNDYAGIYHVGASNTLRFRSGGNYDTLVLDSSRDVTISAGNLIMGTGGKGIDFSANSHATGMTSELLDHYEEGTCTLTCKGSSADPTSAVTETAAYTRIGRQVTVTCYFEAKDTSGASGGWFFDGLPFTSANENDWRGTGGIMTHSMTISGLYLGLSMNANATNFHIYAAVSGGAWVGQAITAGTGKSWHLSLTYFV